MKLKSLPLVLAFVALSAVTVQASEGAAGHYLPGGMATLIDLPPTKAGWVFEPIYLHYEGDSSVARSFPLAGQIAGDLNATSNAFTLGGVYTFERTLLGAHYSLAAYVPYVWMDVSASVTSALGATRRTDRADGFGDITLVPLMMAWKKESWQVNFTLPIYAPTGDFQVGRLANPGLNYWSFDPTLAVSYNNAKTGFNAAIFTGFTFNTENNATDYRSGTVWHVDASIQQLLPLGKGYLGIGANAFYYNQITGDSGSGARLGGFEGRTVGVGPVLSYVLPVAKNTLVTELRWLPELDTKNRLEGNYIWLKVAYQF